MKIDASVTYSKVQFDKENDAHLVISLSAPAVSAEAKRPPLCIIPLIDVSGSMQGEKLIYAKRSIIKLIDHLSANDYCGIVTFTDDAKVLSKPVRCSTDTKEDLKKKVGELEAQASTNISDALLAGFELAKGMDLSTETITRIILFTDGVANVGSVTAPKDIIKLAASNKGSCTISAFGYGSDALQDFLLELSKKGDGNYSFIQNPDDALSTFGKELGGLLSTYATGLVLDISPLAGHRITQVVSDVSADEDDLGQVTIKIPDILSEETRNLVLAIKLESQSKVLPRAVNVFDMKFGYDILDATLRKEHKTEEAKAKIQFVKDGEQDKVPDKELDKIVGLAQIVRAQLEAEQCAKQGNFLRAQQLMTEISDDVVSRGYTGLGGVASTIGSQLGSATAFGCSASYRASFNKGATRGMGGTYSLQAAEDLSACGVQLDNSAQKATSDAFTVDIDTAGSGGRFINP